MLPLHRVLILEDNEDDVHLLLYALRQAGFDPAWEHVATKAAYGQALPEEPDLILADFSLPQFDALQALDLLQKRGLDIPFIVVTGTFEEEAIACMKQGAADYLLKDRLGRLGEAVKRALQQKQLREEKRATEAALRHRNERISLLYDASRRIGRSLDLATIYDTAHEIIAEAMDCDTFIVSHYDADEQLIHCDYIRHGCERLDHATLPPIPLEPEGPGAQSQVIHTGRSLIIDDFQATLSQTRYHVTGGGKALPMVRAEDLPVSASATCSALLVPVKLDRQVVAVLQVQSYQIAAYQQDDLDLLEALAPHLAAATANARLYEQAQADIQERRRAQLAEQEQRAMAEAMRDIATALNQTLDRDELLERILENVSHVVAHDGVNIMIVEGNTARVVRGRGFYEKHDVMAAATSHHFDIEDTPVMKQMVDTGEPVVIVDTHNYEGWKREPFSEWIRSWAGIPIRLEGETVGFLNLDSAHPYAFDETIKPSLKAFAEQVAVALRNVQLYEAEQMRRRIAETLQSAAAALNSTLELDGLLVRILQELEQAIPYDSASVQQREGDRLRLIAVRGFKQPARLLGLEIPIVSKFPNAAVVRQKRPIAVEDVAAVYSHFNDEADTFHSERIKSWLGVPMIVDDEAVGMITVDRWEIRPFTSEEIELATTFAHHAAIALQNAQLYKKLERYSETLEFAVQERTTDLRRTMEQLEVTLGNSPDPILLLDADGIIQDSNPTFQELFGYRTNEIRGQSFVHLVVHEEAATLLQELQVVTSEQRCQRREFVARHKNGRTFDVDLALAPVIQNEVVVGVVCSLRDITALKEVERMKDAFVSNVSHELRTPITSLKLNQDLLARNPAQVEKYLARIRRETERLKRIIEDLLRLSRLDQGRVKLERQIIDLNALAAQYADDRAKLAEKQQLTLEAATTADLPNVFIDVGLIGQVLSILLTNAFNYTPPGGRVTIGTAVQEADGRQWVRFYVSDTGPGISPDEQDKVFDRFHRGQAGRQSGAPGTGLGLSIAKEIVERHGGRIEVHSEDIPGKGTTFTVYLPSSQSQAA